jgi:hypothetical protein
MPSTLNMRKTGGFVKAQVTWSAAQVMPNHQKGDLREGPGSSWLQSQRTGPACSNTTLAN